MRDDRQAAGDGDGKLLLYCSERSPYARIVRAAIRELKLTEQVDERFVVIRMGVINEEVAAVNPLGQIPTLVASDGRSWYDSSLICQYLDLRIGGGRLLPADHAPRLEALQREVIGKTMLDRFIRLMFERMRPGASPEDPFVCTLIAKLERCFDALELKARLWPGDRFDIGDIAIACTLAYADFRFEDIGWRAGRPTLNRWFEGASERPSMIETAFQGAPPQ